MLPGAPRCRASFLVHNFLLWAIPDFERELPTVADQRA